jgi:uncharacterized membrane protein
MVEIKNLNAKQYFAILGAILVLTDIAVLLDILFLRQILGALCFTVVLGLLILSVMKINNIGLFKKLVLSVSLGLFFVMAIGLFVNSLYPYVSKPLSLEPLLVSFNLAISILIVISYKLDKHVFRIENFKNKLIKENEIISPLFIAFLFPILSILGTYLMNSQENNVILLILMFLTLVYSFLIVFLRNLAEITYPVAVLMISLSLQLMYGLTSNYLMGRDVHIEFYVYRLALKDSHWDYLEFPHSYNACLSTTILPVVLHILTGIGGLTIFKIFFGVIASLMPLCVYLICRNYFESRYAFLAALFFAFQFTYLYFLGWIRQLVATLFFGALVLVMFDKEIHGIQKAALSLLFIVSIVFSHYTTTYVSLSIIFMGAFIISLLDKLSITSNNKLPKIRIPTLIFFLLFLAIAFSWYGIATVAPFSDAIVVIEKTLINLFNFYEAEMRNTAEAMVLGLKGWKSVPNGISVFAHHLSFLLVGLGIIEMLRSWIEKERIFTLMAVVSFSLLVFFVLLPYVSLAYGGVRLYQQTLFFLSPAFVLGVKTVARLLGKPKLDKLIALTILALLFMCTTHLQYHFFGSPTSPIYESHGGRRDEEYIFDKDIVAATFLKENGLENYRIYTDRFGYSRLIFAYGKIPDVEAGFFELKQFNGSGYIYLRTANTKGVVYVLSFTGKEYERRSILEYSQIFSDIDRIYSNSGSQIWIGG